LFTIYTNNRDRFGNDEIEKQSDNKYQVPVFIDGKTTANMIKYD